MIHTVIILGTILCMVLFIWQAVRFWNKVSVAALSDIMTVVAAGDIKRNTPMNRPVVVDLGEKNKTERFRSTLQDERYERYIVSGFSMLLANIHTNDIVLANAKVKLSERSKFPCIVVLKRDEKALLRAAKENDYAKFKLRRAWAVCNITANCQHVLNTIFACDEFIKLQNQFAENFLTNEEMKRDFVEYRMAKYKTDFPQCDNASSPYNKIVISTTLHANPATLHPETYNKVTFSIHPLILVQGIVEKSYRTENDK